MWLAQNYKVKSGQDSYIHHVPLPACSESQTPCISNWKCHKLFQWLPVNAGNYQFSFLSSDSRCLHQQVQQGDADTYRHHLYITLQQWAQYIWKWESIWATKDTYLTDHCHLFLGLFNQGFLNCLNYVSLNGATIQDDEVGRNWLWPIIMCYSSICLEGLRKTTETLSQYTNPQPPKYKGRSANYRLQHS
jgi:hypothetical protein